MSNSELATLATEQLEFCKKFMPCQVANAEIIAAHFQELESQEVESSYSDFLVRKEFEEMCLATR